LVGPYIGAATYPTTGAIFIWSKLLACAYYVSLGYPHFGP
jgi:hypothetical protein